MTDFLVFSMLYLLVCSCVFLFYYDYYGFQPKQLIYGIVWLPLVLFWIIITIGRGYFYILKLLWVGLCQFINEDILRKNK